MKNFLDSKILAWCALALVIIIIAMTFMMRGPWWSFIDVFFAFMMVFCHLLAVYFRKLPHPSRQLDLTALVCGILCVLALVGEYIADSILFNL